MTYPIKDGPKVGDIVTIKAVVTRVQAGNVLRVNAAREQGDADIFLVCSENVQEAERPVPPPKVGDLLLSDRPEITTTGTIVGIHDGLWWVRWNTGSYSTVDPKNLGAHNVRASV